MSLADRTARRGWRERWRTRPSLEALCESPGWRGSLFRWTAVALGWLRAVGVLLVVALLFTYGKVVEAIFAAAVLRPYWATGLLVTTFVMIVLPMLLMAWRFLLPRELRTPSRHAWLTRLFVQYDRWEAKLLNGRSQWSPDNLARLDRVVGGWRGVAWVACLVGLMGLNACLLDDAAATWVEFGLNWLLLIAVSSVAIMNLVTSWFSYLKYRDRLLRSVILVLLGAGFTWWQDVLFGVSDPYDLVDLTYAFCLLGLVVLIAFVRKREHDLEIARLCADAARQKVAHQLTSSQLRMLQAQIEPHFLFNSLGTVQHLVDGRAPEAAALNASLIRFLRGSMQSLRANSTALGDEKTLIESYLEIMKARMGERLDYAVDFPPELLERPVPPTMLITLVENAIKHGLEPKPEGGRIDLKARIERGRLRLTVADTGRGFGDIAGSGLGLGNIRERLALRYGKQAALELEARENRGFVAHIVLPLADGAALGADAPELKLVA